MRDVATPSGVLRGVTMIGSWTGLSLLRRVNGPLSSDDKLRRQHVRGIEPRGRGYAGSRWS